MKQAYNVAYGLLTNHDDAEDIAQEAFVKVHRNIQSFRGESAFGTWLHRIVVNLSMTRLRQRKREKKRHLPLEEAGTAPEASHNPHDDRKEASNFVERALHELPTLQRAVVILRHLEGLSTRQVSQILDCSEGTVKTHLHRGLKKMKNQLLFLQHEVA